MRATRGLTALGLLLLCAAAHAQEGWSTSFSPQALATAVPPTQSVVVVPAGTEADRTAAASALVVGLRGSGHVSLVMDASSLGDVAALDDRAIVARAQALPVAAIAIVRVFPGGGGNPSAVVSIYSKTGEPLGSLSAERGLPLAPPQGAADIPPPPPQAPQGAYELTQRPGTVPMTFTSVGRPLSLSVYDGSSYATVGGYYGAYGVSLVTFRPLCETPCTLYLPPGSAQLRVGGFGIRPSVAAFDVPPSGADLRMRAPSLGRHFGGYMLTTTGAGVLVSGIILAAIAHSFDKSTSFAPGPSGEEVEVTTHHNGYLIGGGVLIGVGAVMTGVGIALLATNRSGVASSTPHGATRPTAKLLLGPGGLTAKGTF